MSDISPGKSPAHNQAHVLKSEHDLSYLGLINSGTVYWNLSTEALYEEILFRNEAKLSYMGPLVVSSGEHTARAAKDKFIVKESTTEDKIWWGGYNQPISEERFNALLDRMCKYLEKRDIFVKDCYASADPRYRIPVRIVTEYAWHSLFAHNMFIRSDDSDALRQHNPEFTVLCVPSFKSLGPDEGTRSSTFIILNYKQRLAIIGGSAYGGEIKKTIFTVLNYLVPLKGILTMHCSASQGPKGDVALYFGLSGTGKTSLSADLSRRLIGDDEHGWSDSGVFNFESGCYAKVIKLSPTAEPQIYACTRRYGTIMENVIFDPLTRMVDLDDDAITQNTRASYPLYFIENSIPEKMGGHPKNIILLTCDAQGVMPPIAKLNPNQALYHFISGYTSKVGGTEAGVGDAPEITFSTCFGAPFMVHHPSFYAELLKKKIKRHDVSCWLINTGWVGGSYGIGKRISIGHTRAMLRAALSGSLLGSEHRIDPVFKFEIPLSCEGVPSEVLDPSSSWPSREEYMGKYRQLGERFIENFEKFAPDCSSEVVESGPVL